MFDYAHERPGDVAREGTRDECMHALRFMIF